MREDKAWIQDKHLLCVRYCAKCWGGGTVTSQTSQTLHSSLVNSEHKHCNYNAVRWHCWGAETLSHLIWKDWCWNSFSFRWSLETWCEELTHWKRPYAGKDWRQEKKRTTEDETVGWHHWFNRHELGQTPVDSEGKGSLACCNPWGCKESDST